MNRFIEQRGVFHVLSKGSEMEFGLTDMRLASFIERLVYFDLFYILACFVSLDFARCQPVPASFEYTPDFSE